MKIFKFLMVFLFTISSYSQQVWDMTYLHVPGPEIGNFAQLHKKITDMAQGESRTIQDQWVFRHWYGSGHSVVIVDVFNSAEDAVNDDIWGALGSNYEKLSDEEKETLKPMIEAVVKEGGYTVQMEAMDSQALPFVLTQPEFMRRMKEMQQTGGGGMMMGNMPDMYNLIVNTNHELVSQILATKTEKKRERLIQQAVDLARLSKNLLKGEEMTQFIQRSVDLIK